MEQEQLELKSNYLTTFLRNDYSGFVHSVFSHSLNIQLGKQLIHVSDRIEPLSAFGLKLSNEKIHSLLHLVKVGYFVSYQNNTLFFYNHLNKIISIIKLNELVEKELNIKLISFSSTIKIEDTLFFEELSKLPLKMKTGLPLSEQTLHYIEDLSTYSVEKMSNLSIWQYFIGRGIGLTPSGDDFLIGYISILSLFNQQKEWLHLIRPFVEKGRTTDISLAYLTCLLDGVVNENIKELIDSLYSEDRKEIKQKLSKLLLFGHTSGTDTLYGIMTGIKAMIGIEYKKSE